MAANSTTRDCPSESASPWPKPTSNVDRFFRKDLRLALLAACLRERAKTWGVAEKQEPRGHRLWCFPAPSKAVKEPSSSTLCSEAFYNIISFLMTVAPMTRRRLQTCASNPATCSSSTGPSRPSPGIFGCTGRSAQKNALLTQIWTALMAYLLLFCFYIRTRWNRDFRNRPVWLKLCS